MKEKQQAEIVLFTHGKKQVKLRSDVKSETVWASQAEIADVFGVDRSVVTKHIRNVFSDGELNEKAVCANFAHTADDGKTYKVKYYNLDAIISVGYRVNSVVATRFRQWATKTLRAHITDGFTINRARISENYDAFMDAVDTLKTLAPACRNVVKNLHCV